MPTLKMYVLVRLDLSIQYGFVQAIHAVSLYAIKHPNYFNNWGNGTIVCLGIRNLIDLKKWHQKIEEKGKVYSCFYEPDLDNQLTAIACYDTGEIFINLKTA